MKITNKMIQDLQEKIGAGVADCKKALITVNGDIEKAKDWLIKRGTASKNKIKERGVKAFLLDLVKKRP